jgi:peroxiredoxin Q/BCP
MIPIPSQPVAVGRGKGGAFLVWVVFPATLSIGCAGATASAAPSTVSAVDTTPGEPSIVVTSEMGSPHVGDSAPDFELVAQDGSHVKLSSLHGQVVMLAFVTSWCPFSEAEQPNLKELAAHYAGKNVKVVAVDIKDDDAGYQKYLDRVKLPFPVLRDPTGEVTARFTPDHAQPAIKDRSTVLVTSNLVVDPQGKIVFFTMVDTMHFDARLVNARRAIDGELARAGGV